MNRKREAIFMGIGILTGLALSGPAAQAATAVLTASPTRQTFYLNGQRVEFEAYSIHDNNFVKLRDIAQAVDFGVTYNAATNSVYIDPDAPYQEEATSSALTEAAVQATIWALRDVYPTGTVYGEFYRSETNGPYGRAPPTARAGPLCAPTPPSATCRGGGSTTRAGKTSAPATWSDTTTPPGVMWSWCLTRRTNTSWSPKAEPIIRRDGADSTTAGGWRSSPDIPATRDIRNRRPQ